MYGEALLAGQRGDDAEDEEDTGRPPRTRTTRTNGYAGYDFEDGSEGAQSSGNEWQGGDDEEDNDFEGDDEEEASGDESVVNGETPSLVVQLRYGKGKAPISSNSPSVEQPAKDTTQEGGTTEQQPPTQQESGVNGSLDTAQDASAAPDSQMQLDDKPTAGQQSLEPPKEQPNGIAEGSHVSIGLEALIAQPAAVLNTNETG